MLYAYWKHNVEILILIDAIISPMDILSFIFLLHWNVTHVSLIEEFMCSNWSICRFLQSMLCKTWMLILNSHLKITPSMLLQMWYAHLFPDLSILKFEAYNLWVIHLIFYCFLVCLTIIESSLDNTCLLSCPTQYAMLHAFFLFLWDYR